MSEANQIREFLQSELSLTCLPGSSLNDLIDSLSIRINQLIQSDFNQLIRMLYRIDVDENRLKKLLKDDAGNDSGLLIATLIVERQLQKMKKREENHSSKNQEGEEKW
ncbi:MAG: hypothetical protein ACHQET_10110 [Chitinophagales bacterium]